MISVVAVVILIGACAFYVVALVLIFKLIRKKSTKIAGVVVAALLLLTSIVRYLAWPSGTVYGDREYDETGQYYFQRYSTIGPSVFRMSMPGGGSDSIAGFIRLFDSERNLT